jgi:hypothetical protein
MATIRGVMPRRKDLPAGAALDDVLGAEAGERLKAR